MTDYDCFLTLGTYNKMNNFAAPICIALKKKWRSTIKTITQFPVDRGTVVELACSDTDAVFKGNNIVTCIHGRDFNFSDDPECHIPGMFYANPSSSCAIRLKTSKKMRESGFR